MEFLDQIGAWFTRFTSAVERIITGIFGASNERHIKKIGFVRDKKGVQTIIPGSLLDKIQKLEPHYQSLSDDELRQTASKLRKRLDEGETLDDILPDSFAATRESGWRYLKMRHYDVQMVGGYFLHKGMIAEMVTGEGKTLVATLSAALNAMSGSVHVVTVNDYLALRDMEWMGQTYIGLGLTVDAIQSNMSPQRRQQAYACDITYGTNNEFGFDYLRDNMKPTKDLQVQGEPNYAIVDEIDNILIDEARTPLIISGPAHDDITKYPKADRIARQLEQGVHFEVKEKEHTCHLTEVGIRKAEELAGVDSFYTAGNMEWPHLIDNSLRAHHLFKLDVTYVVEGGEVVIVDEFTGRKMEGRQWSDGLHQAVQTKEGVEIKAENQTLATITLQNFFKLYKKLSGMTGTAMTEAEEFWKIYKLDVMAIPTNKPLQRVNHPDVIYLTEKEKWNAVVEEIRDVNKTERPVLVGTTTIETSELLSKKLNKYGIKHDVLNAKYHEREAEIIAQAGRSSAVTIATNMAGRGTDIILGGNPEHMAWEDLKEKYESRLEVPKFEWDECTAKIADKEGMIDNGKKVMDVGGLHVIGTERHDSRRIDLQLRGRAGRQGDPGSSRFSLSLEDKLLKLFAGDWVKTWLTKLGMKEGEAIESKMVTNKIEGAQKKVEERHFDARKHLLEYDEVMDEQRKQVYSYRQRILDGDNCRDLVLNMISEQLEEAASHFLNPTYRDDSIRAWAEQVLNVDIESSAIHGMNKEQLVSFIQSEAHSQADVIIHEQIEQNLPEEIEDESEWNWIALSRWANAYFSLNTNDRELKKIGRDGLYQYLRDRSNDTIDRFKYDELDLLLEKDLGIKSFCGWMHQQLAITIVPEELSSMEPNVVQDHLLEKVKTQYREKEIGFPVAVGMAKFLSGSQGGEKYNREGLIQWANNRFEANLTMDDFKSVSRDEISKILTGTSREFYRGVKEVDQLNDYLDQLYGDENDQDTAPLNGQADEVVSQIQNWAKDSLKSETDLDELKTLSREEANRKLMHDIESRYRPELAQAERSLILEVLDTAWKDHLYYMDHLRQGIGLVGYAQKDPKVEYKREGRKAFLNLWNSIGNQVSSAIFRIEKESPDFVGSLWEITSTVHEEASSSDAYVENHDQSIPEPGAAPQTIDPIINRLPKVGRNDPCPCGSGKKYKKCCGNN
jgi:preprotein translocase subunit SecA